MVGAINPMMQPGMPEPGTEGYEEARTERAFKELESLFLNLLLKEMRKTVPDGGLFEKNQESSFYEEMLDEVFAKAMAESEQYGVAAQMAKQLREREEGSKAVTKLRVEREAVRSQGVK